jgi:hypothetical protein
VWKKSRAIEHFVGNKNLRVPSTPGNVRILHDNNKIYFSGTFTQPLLKEFAEKEHGKNKFPQFDSVEILVVPDKNKPDNIFQLVLDTSNSIFTMKKVPSVNNSLKPIVGWNMNAEYVVKKTDDRWSFELAVPVKTFEKEIDRDWKILVAYNRFVQKTPLQIFNYACAFTDGKGFHATDKYLTLNFVKNANVTNTRPEIKVFSTKKESKTHTSGTGSLITFGVKVNAKRPMYDVSLKAVFVGKDNVKLNEEEIISLPYLSLTWRTSQLFRKQLQNTHEAVKVKFILSYNTLEGDEKIFEHSIILGKQKDLYSEKSTFGKGVNNSDRALAVPAYINTIANKKNYLSFKRGSFSFWIKPNWDTYENKNTMGANKYRVLINCALMRPKHPVNRNKHSFTILKHKSAGWLYFQISSERYLRRMVYCRLPNWKKGDWHHMAFSWDMNKDGRAYMAIFLDGKLQKTKINGSHGCGDKPLKIRENIYPLQIGSMNSGLMKADAMFDNILISRSVVYEDSFDCRAVLPQATLPESMFFNFEQSNAKVNFGSVYNFYDMGVK